MAGSGKSKVGEIAARLLGWKFVDLDKQILQTQGMTHDDYMKKYGEQALSDLEQKLTLELDMQDVVFAPPGSMVYAEKAMEKIKQDTLVVYLKTIPEIIKKRLGQKLYHNGIIGLAEKGLSKLMAERAVLYEKYADYTFESGEQTKEEMAKIVLDGLQAAGVNIGQRI